jgi:hypothetical protein
MSLAFITSNRSPGLQVDVPGIRRGGDILDRLCIARIAHIDHAESLGKHMADEGVALVDHHLHAVRTSALIGMSDQLHVPDVIRRGQVLTGHSRRS